MKTIVASAFTLLFFLIAQSTIEQTSKGEVAITFDDGPSPTTTYEIIDILKQFHAFATFFVKGENVERFPTLLIPIVRSGNEIGNHTWSHPRCNRLAITTFEKEVKATNSEIQKVTGGVPTLFRFPYGIGTRAEELEVRREGMTPVLWSTDPRDWRNPSPNVIVNRVLSHVRAGNVILLHEGKKNTLKALPLILAGLEQRGLRSVTLSQLIYNEQHIQAPS